MPILSSCGIKWNKAQKNILLKGRHPLNVSLLEIAWDKIITNTLQLRAFSPVRSIQFHSVQLLSHVRLFAIPWTSACQASLSITDSWSLLKFMSIKSVMPFNHLILCCPFLLLPSIFPTSGSFQMSQFFSSGGLGIGASASASVLLMNIKDWFPLGLTGWISLQSKGLSRVFSNTTVHKAYIKFINKLKLLFI